MVDYVNRPPGETRLVTIVSTNLRALTAKAQDHLETEYIVDLTHSIGVFSPIPAAGERWIIESFGADWKLKDRVGYQNPNIPGTLEVDSVRLVRKKGKFTFIDRDGDWGERIKQLEALLKEPEWTPFTAAELSGYRAGTFGYAPSHTKHLDGKIELRGIVDGLDGTSPNKNLIKLPDALVPEKTVQFTQASTRAGVATGYCRVEIIGKDGTSNIGYLRAFPYTNDVTWVSIDRISYYLH